MLCSTAPLFSQEIVSVRQVGQLTGQPSINNTGQVNVYGTDLGSMFGHSDGRIYFLFGDTFGAPGPPGSDDWRSNTMAFSSDSVARDGIQFDGWITDVAGHAAALIEGDHDPNNGLGEVTKIPTAGWSSDGRHYMWFMSVKRWGAAGQWYTNFAEIAYSENNGNDWIRSGVQKPGESNFIQVAFAEYDGYLYIWGIPAGRLGGVKLARVPPSDILDESAYSYYDGTEWLSEEADGVIIVDPPVGELSVLWNSFLQRWIMMYLNESTASIEVRQAEYPQGPWSQPTQVVSAVEYPALYGAYMHESYIENEGETVYFLMSQFTHYNVFLMEVVFRENISKLELDPSSPAPRSFLLFQNYPNPFNSYTKIRFYLPDAVRINLSVYNIEGQLIRNLLSAQLAAGRHSIIWNGKDDFGEQVGCGIYFYRFEAENSVLMRKVLLLN